MKEFRPEQMRMAKVLRELLSVPSYVKVEYPVKGMSPTKEGIRCDYCQLDIAIVSPPMATQYANIAIRIMGEVHPTYTGLKKRKDDDQRLVLEANGWIVIDIFKTEYPSFWGNDEEKMKEDLIKILT